MKRRSATEAEDDVEVLRGKLEVAQLKNALLELQRKNASLQAVVDQQCAVIKENTALLCKQRLPPRPYMNSTSKALIAQAQGFCCGNPGGDCPLYKLGDGRFGKDLWECDHIEMYSKSGKHTGNIRAICSYCHAVVTRLQIAQQNVEDDRESLE
jgi:hypothetical protein